MTAKKTEELEDLAGMLPAIIATQKDMLAAKVSEMQALKKAGLIYANEHWRDGKYLYLIFPSRGGDRERRYVGADEKKIADAKASIQRAKDYDVLASEVRGIEQRLSRGRESLQSALAFFTGDYRTGYAHW